MLHDGSNKCMIYNALFHKFDCTNDSSHYFVQLI